MNLIAKTEILATIDLSLPEGEEPRRGDIYAELQAEDDELRWIVYCDGRDAQLGRFAAEGIRSMCASIGAAWGSACWGFAWSPAGEALTDIVYA